jgi:Protein of unknown function (DUF742)
VTRDEARPAVPGSAVPGGRHARRTPEPADLTGGGPAPSASVRPYFYTRGRTRAAVELALEALVSTVPGVAVTAGPAQAAYELCREPRSVAEIAALMRVPLGVARVLVGDLVVAGSVMVHRTADAAGPDLTLMRRVLTGLRNL